MLERASGKDLKWFFEDWVYHDRGLPDLSIAGVYPNKASVPGSYIVAVDVANSGTAEAEVPVSVSSGTTTVTERLRIPAKSRISHRFLLQGQPAEVAVNDGTVPEVEASVHRQTLCRSVASALGSSGKCCMSDQPSPDSRPANVCLRLEDFHSAAPGATTWAWTPGFKLSPG